MDSVDSKFLREKDIESTQRRKVRLAGKHTERGFTTNKPWQQMGCGYGRKKCHICSGTGKALNKGHGNMKEYRRLRAFSNEDACIFGDNDYIGLLSWEEFSSLIDENDQFEE